MAYYLLHGDANDASGNGYHGTMTELVPTTDRFNQANGALQFNGTTSAIDVPYSLPFNVDPFTITAWINWAGSCPNTYTAYSECVIFMRENMYALAVRDGTLQFAIGTLSAKTNSWQWINTDVKIQANQWTHVALQFDKGSIASVYINGKFIKSNLYPDRVLYADPFIMYYGIPLSIGRRTALGGTPFYGALSDIRIYNRVLTVEELGQLAENNTPQFTTAWINWDGICPNHYWDDNEVLSLAESQFMHSLCGAEHYSLQFIHWTNRGLGLIRVLQCL
ncbi:MAG: hypothetical protein RL368_1356 [Pseudomonadota bacterium]